MGAEEVIKFDGFSEGRDWVAYKYHENRFLLGSQLIVNPSQEAIFIKGGKICDIFGAGTHSLVPENLPVLSRFIKLHFGLKTPIAADIIFVNKAARLDMRWGTATPFQLEDSKYGIIVSIRAHGKYGVKIMNSGLFVGELIGSAPSNSVFTHSFVNTYFNSMLISYIKSTISSFMIERKISFLEVNSYLTELSKECNELVASEFYRFGIEITNLCIETISPPDSDFEELKRIKEKHVSDYISAGSGSSVYSGDETADVNGAQRAFGTVTCPVCKSGVPVNQKFCGECGNKMVKKCIFCGGEWGVTQKFCGECGNKL